MELKTKQKESQNQMKICFFEKVDKIDKPITRMTKEKKDTNS